MVGNLLKLFQNLFYFLYHCFITCVCFSHFITSEIPRQHLELSGSSLNVVINSHNFKKETTHLP